MGYNLLIHGIYWGYNLLTNHLLNLWDIQVMPRRWWSLIYEEKGWASTSTMRRGSRIPTSGSMSFRQSRLRWVILTRLGGFKVSTHLQKYAHVKIGSFPPKNRDENNIES